MSKNSYIFLVFVFLISQSALSSAAEDQKIKSATPSPKTTSTPAALADTENSQKQILPETLTNKIRHLARDYIEEKAGSAGTLDVEDPEVNTTRKLSFESVQQDIGKVTVKNVSSYVVHVNMKDVRTNEQVDVDVDINEQAGVYSVVNVGVYKVSGTPRYIYDDKNNRVPVSVVTESK